MNHEYGVIVNLFFCLGPRLKCTKTGAKVKWVNRCWMRLARIVLLSYYFQWLSAMTCVPGDQTERLKNENYRCKSA